MRTGSAHESAALNGISHVIEHMAFKGTAERDVQRINLDAERLGAEVNAHTDKDHTAYHMRGLAEHAADFVRMLADIVLHATFPDDELERERQVLLQEFAEDEDDPMSTGYKLFDHACYGLHPVAQPVIGSRRNIERFQRDDLVRYVERQYTGANLIVGAAGAIDADAIVRAAEAAFGALPSGHAEPDRCRRPMPAAYAPARWPAAARRTWCSASRSRRCATTTRPQHVAAAVFGDGMSSPLLASVREQRGLAYHASCIADQFDMCGQFVIEASTAPEQFDEFLREVTAPAARAGRSRSTRWISSARATRSRCADCTTPRNRCAGSRTRRSKSSCTAACARPARRWNACRRSTPTQVRTAFARMLAAGPSAAIVGSVRRGAGDRAREILSAAARRN